MKKIVLDIETKNTFSQVGSTDAARLDLSLLVVYDFETDRYQSFLEQELPKLWPLLERTDLIIGYNSDTFDIPLLNKYYSGDLTKIKSLDLLVEIRKSLGRRLSLDMVAAGTLGAGKSGDGLAAVRWWQQGEIEKIRHYCQEDVRLTKELYEYALAHQHLRYKIIQEVKQFPIDTSRWDEPASSTLNYTLPW
ncbi:MAG: hypothetical protein A3J59_03955 [Candidatus Buchananbacteria bacterium RIFCSPHIGHO2_02_FULL_56_16]|uniref:YprB ribonuclease H-like domain-containing protein n=1 Tax=Candidatus Buchananbacteria bacterium RIFCSPHIGHO2_02_FULL_56_16 TaxID=1797542 RepID=A0A1G1YI81_9BACT|nr:MAG: hypothetical protein A3J59_03955 [Candidatus Buchananbacteria bacterium RIFCSPHIGHO2_02_FULL_56_16]